MRKSILTAFGVLSFLIITPIVYAEETMTISSPSTDTTLDYGGSVVIRWKSTVPIGWGSNASPGVFRVFARDTKIGTLRSLQTVDSCTINKGGSDVNNTYDCWLEWRPFDSYGSVPYEIIIQHADTGFTATAPGKVTPQIREASVTITNPSRNIKVSVGDVVPIRWTTKIPTSSGDTTPYAGISLRNESTKTETTIAYDIGRYDRTTDKNNDYTIYIGEYNWKPDASHANGTYRFRIWHKGGALETISDTVTVVSSNTAAIPPSPVVTPKPTIPVASNTNEAILQAQLAIYIQLLKTLVQLMVMQGSIDSATANQVLAPFANY